MRDNVDVSFYGSMTTCTDLNSFLVSREEQVGFVCQAAKSELQETCCFQKCSICGSGGNLYWDNPVEFNNMTFACGELTWILSGNMVEEGTKECDSIQATYFDVCCNGPSSEIPQGGEKCEICPAGKDWYAQVTYDGKPITCLELDAALLQNGVFDLSTECTQAMLQYSSHCCYTPPVKPCNLCHLGEKFYSISDKSVTYNGAETSCSGIYNYLITRIETDDDTCIATTNDLFDECCYDKCSLCQDYQLDQEAVTVHNGTSMGCSEIENYFISLNQIRQGSEQCLSLQQTHFEDCCYDIPCNLCMTGDSTNELLIDEPVTFMGRNRTCGDVSVLVESEMSQSDVCKTTKSNISDRCCFKPCNICDQGWAMDWNHALSYEGLASTCLDVYTSLRSERVADGDDRCVSIQYTVSNECCYKMPTNQCALCQSSNGTFLNTNWNYEVTYLGATVTCGDISAMLSSEELDSAVCLTARDEFWNKCCVPQQGGYKGIGGVFPTLPPEVSEHDSTESDPTGVSYGDEGFATFFRRSGAQGSRPGFSLMALPFIAICLFLGIA